MPSRSALLAALLLAAPFAVRAQAPVPFPDPTPTDTSGAELCTSHAGTTVCRQRDAEGEESYVVRRDGSAARWPVPLTSFADYTFAAFRLDDGTLLVANCDATSNGIGISLWTVYVLPSGATAPAYQFASEEFGLNGESFGTWRGRPVVWATEWINGLDPSGRRGGGLYFVGRPFVVGPGGLEPATGVSLRARRYLNSFAEQRGQTASATPRAWLMDRRAETRRTDPALAGCRSTTERGTVTAIERATGDYSISYLVITLDGGQRFSYGRWGGGESGAPHELAHLGTGGRLLPTGYQLASPERQLSGRPVRVETCGGLQADYDTARVLWLE